MIKRNPTNKRCPEYIILSTITLSILLVYSPIIIASKDKTSSHSNINTASSHALAQIDWVRSNGGFFHPHLSIQSNGVFASHGPISKGETVMIVPQSCILTSRLSEDDEDDTSKNTCDTVRNLAKQRNLGASSEYEPYVTYLYEDFLVNTSPLPSIWSEEGRIAIETVLGNEIDPGAEGMTAVSFEQYCRFTKDERNDPEQIRALEEAHLMVLSRSWDDKMLPVFDMCNHRNGAWRSVDSNSAHEGEDITVYAIKDVKMGEQIYLSYNECKDCDFALTYVAPDILRDFGFVEQYPTRLKFGPEGDIVFEIDEKMVMDKGENETTKDKELELRWLTNPKLDLHQLHLLRGQQKRLRNLETKMTNLTSELPENERETTLRLYNVLTLGLKLAIKSAEENLEEQPPSSSSSSPSSSSSLTYPVIPTDNSIIFPEHVCKSSVDSHKSIQKFNTLHQKIEYSIRRDGSEACLWINDNVNACTSFRPHYHEIFVHYPARFVPRPIKRVLFFGGGGGDNNFVLHEILKFTELEKVVGLGLDHQACRSSYIHFETSPRWEDERVEWWYGDGVVSLEMFPREYYGSFDLVLVDLPTDVVNFDDVSLGGIGDDGMVDIVDAASLLLNDEWGVMVVMNYEYSSEFNQHANYMVDMYYVDVPIICYQELTLMSNSVDFYKAIPKDRGVDTLFLGPIVDEGKARGDRDRFDMWYNYHQSEHAREKIICTNGEDNIKATDDGNNDGDDERRRRGVFIVLEVDHATLVASSSQQTFERLLSTALTQQMDLNVSSILTYRDKIDDEKNDPYVTVVFLQEGYVVARTWPRHSYVAFDLLLWKKYDKMDAIRNALLNAVGHDAGKAEESSPFSSSSYRMVMGAPLVKEDGNDSDMEVGPPTRDEVCGGRESDGILSKEEDDAITNVDVGVGNDVLEAAIESGITSLIQKDDDSNASSIAIVVLCGDESLGGTVGCPTLDIFSTKIKNTMMKVVPLWTCRAIISSEGQIDDEALFPCENETLQRLRDGLNGGTTIDSIIIDPNAPQSMGRVLNAILSDINHRREFLPEDDTYIVMSVSSLNEEESSWRLHLMDRFLSTFSRYHPSYRAEVRLYSSTNDDKKDEATDEMGRWELFSSGDEHFFAHLTNAIERIEMISTNESTTDQQRRLFKGELKRVRKGTSEYVPDFEPSFIASVDDYDREYVEKQWESQQPVGRQTLFKYELSQYDMMVKNQHHQQQQHLFITMLSSALKKTLRLFISDENDAEYELRHKTIAIGDGCLHVSFFTCGNLMATWDGRSRVDVNLFTCHERFDTSDDELEVHFDFQEEFETSVKGMEAISYESVPRGYGGVINYWEELEDLRDGGLYGSRGEEVDNVDDERAGDNRSDEEVCDPALQRCNIF